MEIIRETKYSKQRLSWRWHHARLKTNKILERRLEKNCYSGDTKIIQTAIFSDEKSREIQHASNLYLHSCEESPKVSLDMHRQTHRGTRVWHEALKLLVKSKKHKGNITNFFP